MTRMAQELGAGSVVEGSVRLDNGACGSPFN